MASTRSFSRILALPPHIRRNLYSTAASTPSSPEIYDLVCIGGGPAGLSLISALRSNPTTRNLKIALIDSQSLSSNASNDPHHYSNRCSSLTPSSVRFLQQIGAWEHLNTSRIQPYHTMNVWDGVSGSRIDFDPMDSTGGGSILDSIAQMIPGSRVAERKREQNDAIEVATMCENSNLTASLLKRLGQEGGEGGARVEIFDTTKVQSIKLGPEPIDEKESSADLSQWPIVTLPEGRSLAARLLVGADGANSPVRQFAGISSHGWDYNQHGIVATLQISQSSPSEPPLRTAYQRFLPTGPIALLPLPGNVASLVWSISAQYAPRIKQLPPKEFTEMINAAFRLKFVDIDYLLNNPTSCPIEELSWREPNTSPIETGLPTTFPRITGLQESSIASFPLRMRHASTYTGHRIALIGDAAHTIHPLAGQGLNLGLSDSESLAKLLARGVEHGMDIGSCWCLDDYNSSRWAMNNAMLGAVDKLQKIYGVASGPVVWGRSAGLGILDRLGGVKGGLMRAAAGR